MLGYFKIAYQTTLIVLSLYWVYLDIIYLFEIGKLYLSTPNTMLTQKLNIRTLGKMPTALVLCGQFGQNGAFDCISESSSAKGAPLA